MVKKKGNAPWKVLIAILLGVICGTWTGTDGGLFGFKFYDFYSLVSQLFINSLMLIVVPLVSSSIITGIARIGGESTFGRLGLKIFGFYIGTSLIAILVGLFFVNLFNPGSSFIASGSTLVSSQMAQQVQREMATNQALTFSHILLQIVPANIVDAFHGQMLGLIFFSILFGYALSKIEQQPLSLVVGFIQGVFQTMLGITDIIMKVLPLGVFCLVAKSFATSGLESLPSLAIFFFTVVAALACFMFLVLPLLLKVMGRINNPYLSLRAMAPALVTAFSTSSSSATLPVTIDCAEKRAGVSNRICSLVIPLGTSINMSGSALYECVAAMFIAQVYGIDLSFTTQFSVVLLALVTSIGVAGIPSASIISIIIILKAIGLPAEGIGLLFAVDRILDMCRTTVNVFSDSCCAILVAKTEGEKDVLAKSIFEAEPA